MNTSETAGSTLLRAGVLGGAGYTGMEVLGLLARHPRVEVSFAASRSLAGTPSPVPGLSYEPPSLEACGEVELVFLCLPHGVATRWVQDLRDAFGDATPRLIDLTADHRPGSGNEQDSVYGLAEVAAARMPDARLVANPGCYPTGVILSLLPLAEAGLVDPARPLSVHAASGVTGAGRTPRQDLLFAEVAENYRAYGWGNRHRHLKEMRALLPGLPLIFQPHLLPVARGILETLTVPVVPGTSAQEIRECWRGRYPEDSSAVRVLPEGLPELRQVVRTDLLVLGAEEVAGIDPPVVTVGAALDNLGKGAAGQAVQNMNAMMGWPLNEGIRWQP